MEDFPTAVDSPEACMRGAEIVVVATNSLGSEDKYDRAKVEGLKEVLLGKIPGRTSANQVGLFKSVGTAVQDVMAGFAVYEEAVGQGRGQDSGEFLELKMF